MASRGRGRRGRPRGTGQALPTFDQLPVFDQQAFAEAVGVARLRAGNLSPARWTSPTNPKLGLVFNFVGPKKTGPNLARLD